MNEKEIIEALEITLGNTAQQMRETQAEMAGVLKMATAFRKDYDELMDAVHYLSVMYGTSQESDAMNRLQIIYTRLQNTWGG
tara:strand:- start:281 stop:526 length:246 start_codon:yes stop_codon:yes gene_type:complete